MILIKDYEIEDNVYRKLNATEVIAKAIKESNCSIRLNERSNKFEIIINGEMPHQDYSQAVKALYVHLMDNCRIEPQDSAQVPSKLPEMSTRTKAEDRLVAIALQNKYDPFIEWIENIAPWDGISRIEPFFIKHWQIEDNEHNRWAVRFMFMCQIVRAYRPGAPAKRTPIIFGPQNALKSWTLRHILPQDYQFTWYGEIDNLADTAKSLGEKLEGRSIVELSELGGLKKADMDKTKAFISREDDGIYRGAYARNSVSKPRRCALVGTANPKVAHIQDDSSGSTRFACLTIKKPEDMNGFQSYLLENRGQMWAEALHKYREGSSEWSDPYPYNSDEYWAIQNEGYKMDNDYEDYLQEIIIYDRPFTMGQLVKSMKENDLGFVKYNHIVKKALIKRGYQEPVTNTRYQPSSGADLDVPNTSQRWWYPGDWNENHENRDKDIRSSLKNWDS